MASALTSAATSRRCSNCPELPCYQEMSVTMRGHASEAISRPGGRSSGVTQSRSNGVRAHSAWMTPRHERYIAVILLTLVIAGIVVWGLHERKIGRAHV